MTTILKECLNEMDIIEAETMVTALKVKDKEASDVGKFLNRILGLNVERQNLVRKILFVFKSLFGHSLLSL